MKIFQLSRPTKIRSALRTEEHFPDPVTFVLDVLDQFGKVFVGETGHSEAIATNASLVKQFFFLQTHATLSVLCARSSRVAPEALDENLSALETNENS